MDKGEEIEANFYEKLGLKYVPSRYITPEMCERAVNECGLYLEYVPEMASVD